MALSRIKGLAGLGMLGAAPSLNLIPVAPTDPTTVLNAKQTLNNAILQFKSDLYAWWVGSSINYQSMISAAGATDRAISIPANADQLLSNLSTLVPDPIGYLQTDPNWSSALDGELQQIGSLIANLASAQLAASRAVSTPAPAPAPVVVSPAISMTAPAAQPMPATPTSPAPGQTAAPSSAVATIQTVSPGAGSSDGGVSFATGDGGIRNVSTAAPTQPVVAAPSSNSRALWIIGAVIVGAYLFGQRKKSR